MKTTLFLLLLTIFAFNCKKDDTKPAQVDGISIKTPPAKTGYYADEEINLSGLTVTLTMSDGSTKDVPFADFESNGLSCSPENGAKASTTNNAITITHSSSGKSAIIDITVDKFKDARDGQIYKFVKIGNQIWMAENLNYYTSSGSWYYNNDSAAYSKPYGRLYLWETVMNGESASDAVPSGVKGICPNGWHFPSSGEFQILADYLAANGLTGSDLKESGGQHWGEYNTGTNSTGFSAVGSGTMYNNGTQSVYINSFADFITSSYHSGIDSWGLRNGSTFQKGKLGPDNAWCVRCIQDQNK
jgi:uncharacterized protein (TIGR02145 family)